MGVISKGGTLPDTGVTKAQIYKLVDNATISGIVNAEISASAAITDTKLATISTAGKVSATAITELNNGTVNPTNLLSNGDFECWSAGTSAAPDGWLAGGESGQSFAREPTIVKMGTYSCKMISGVNTVSSIHTYPFFFIPPQGIAYWRGRQMTVSCWVNTSTAGCFQITLGDNISWKASITHTGSGNWELITVTYTIDNAATYINIQFVALPITSVSTTTYLDGAMCVEGSSAFAFSDKPAGYLEGTWTPTVTFGGGSTGITYTGQTGKWTKIGNFVFLTGYFQITGKGSSTGNMAINGLPFVAADYSACSVRVQTVTNLGTMILELDKGNSSLFPKSLSTTGTLTNTADTNVSNNADFMFSIFYKTE